MVPVPRKEGKGREGKQKEAAIDWNGGMPTRHLINGPFLSGALHTQQKMSNLTLFSFFPLLDFPGSWVIVH